MTNVQNSPSAPSKSRITASDILAEFAVPPQVHQPDAECCVQDIDPSGAASSLRTGPCNLECSFCATRWSARRILQEQEA